MENNDAYLGDGLYARFDGYQFELYTHDGYSKTTSVFLEPQVYFAFKNFADKIFEHKTEEENTQW